jgi:ectoine hydroxylase-related dioxygenase (phytanoyl-CoA dioxygenase family)
LGQCIYKLVCSDETAMCLEALDGEPQHTVHQAILFFVPPGTGTHIDGWALDTHPPGNFMTMWVPLETVTLHNGPVAVFPWKHGKFLSPEMLGVDLSGKDSRMAYLTYADALVRSVHDRGISCVVPQLEPGDFIVFSSLTPHATMPALNEHQRRMALQILARPTASRWGGVMMERLAGDVMEGNPPRAIKVGKGWHALSNT